MLFITNRALDQSHLSRTGRPITFDLRDISALPSLFYCRRNAPGDYTEIGSLSFYEVVRESPYKQVLFFVHGFNEFPEATIFQEAQILQEELDAFEPDLVQVIPLIWPAKADEARRLILTGYYDSQIAADASGYAFARALEKFQTWQMEQDEEIPCLKAINILTHSMGARVLRETLRIWSGEMLRHEPPFIFRNIFLVAPDLVNETLESDQDGNLIVISSRNVVVYFASDDLPLRGSKVANARQVSRRLGHTGPESMSRVANNVYARDCSDFNTEYDSPLGHTYFLRDENGAAGLVLRHISETIRDGRLPDRDQRSAVLS